MRREIAASKCRIPCMIRDCRSLFPSSVLLSSFRLRGHAYWRTGPSGRENQPEISFSGDRKTPQRRTTLLMSECARYLYRPPPRWAALAPESHPLAPPQYRERLGDRGGEDQKVPFDLRRSAARVRGVGGAACGTR